MPELSKLDAAERLAEVVEKAAPYELEEIYAELFPEQQSTHSPVASDIARYIRMGIEAEEIVDLWNVVFPQDHHGITSRPTPFTTTKRRSISATDCPKLLPSSE